MPIYLHTFTKAVYSQIKLFQKILSVTFKGTTKKIRKGSFN